MHKQLSIYIANPNLLAEDMKQEWYDGVDGLTTKIELHKFMRLSKQEYSDYVATKELPEDYVERIYRID